jgi:hypothetical protein
VDARFPMRMGPTFALGRLWYLARSANSYVEVGENSILARMGWFRLSLQSAEIGLVEKKDWPWPSFWFGGWRIWRESGTIIFGAPGEVVYLEMRQPVWKFAGVFPMRVRRVFLSVDDAGHLNHAINQSKKHARAAVV